MGQEPDQLRADIERTRAELDRDVDALTEKVSPGRIVDRRVQRTRSTVRSWKDKVMGTTSSAAGSAGGVASSAGDAVQSTAGAIEDRTRGNPLAAGVIAFGVGWLASSLLPATKVEERAGGKVREVASEHGGAVTEQVKAVASDVADQMREPAREAAQSVQQTAKDGAQNVTAEGRSQAQEAREAHSSA